MTPPRSTTAAMVAMAYVPLLHAGGAAAILLLATGWWKWLGLAWLLLLPPVVVRLSQWMRPVPSRCALGSTSFLRWWWQSQWQVVFNRLPMIEEVVRLVPGLYAQWLRLWGSDIGRLVYWTPGLRVLDRQLLRLGDGCSFGVNVSLNPHVIGPHPQTGERTLLVAPVVVGRNAIVGGESTLTAGAWVGDGENSPPKLTFRPFTGWRHGRRVTPDAGAA